MLTEMAPTADFRGVIVSNKDHIRADSGSLYASMVDIRLK
jgi:hypothetical protein